MTDLICIPKELPDFVQEQLAGLRNVLPGSICLQCNYDISKDAFCVRFMLPIVTSLELEENSEADCKEKARRILQNMLEFAQKELTLLEDIK